MKLVLLSGGSGTRLWPLSNKTKPKQFIEVLKNDVGEYESMFQRVIRQIKQSGLLADTYIATTKQHTKWIHSQLTDDIPIIEEPFSRDTFPAIGLAAVYLSEQFQDLDEVVCVCPVDVFAEESFFGTLKEAERILEEHPYNLALIGIQPVYPAEKYGYIVPEVSVQPVLKVKQFVEKPNQDKAKELIAQKAMWNGGVFCFKIRFLIELLSEKGISLKYSEMIDNYSEMPKISFDYEVVEKADSVVVVPYRGSWNDLGTWDVLTEKMDRSVIGKGHISEDSTNTHIINHLDIPVLGVGLTDVVIVSNEEGILVADKRSSIQLKEHMKEMN